MNRVLRRTLRRAQYAMGDHPAFLPLQLLATPESTLGRRITRRSQLVIEGFPRSGNTFAERAFQLAQRRPVVVHSHVHFPAQVKVAARRGVPLLVAIRRPVDTVTSLVVYAPHVPPEDGLRQWLHYHLEVAPLADRFVLATFDEITTDFGIVVDRVNACFGTAFDRFEHTPQNVDEVFAAIDEKHTRIHGPTAYGARVPRPDSSRESDKRRVQAEFQRPALQPLIAAAEAVYDAMVRDRSTG